MSDPSISELARQVQELKEGRKHQWPLYSILLSMLLAGLAGIWKITDLKIHSATSPILQKLANADAAIGTLNKEANDFHNKTASNETLSKANAATIATITAKLIELQKQVSADVTALHDETAERSTRNLELATKIEAEMRILNLHIAQLDRLCHIMWDQFKTLGPYPDGSEHSELVTPHTALQ